MSTLTNISELKTPCLVAGDVGHFACVTTPQYFCSENAAFYPRWAPLGCTSSVTNLFALVSELAKFRMNRRT